MRKFLKSLWLPGRIKRLEYDMMYAERFMEYVIKDYAKMDKELTELVPHIERLTDVVMQITAMIEEAGDEVEDKGDVH